MFRFLWHSLSLVTLLAVYPQAHAAASHSHNAAPATRPTATRPSQAEQYERMVEQKLKHTYAATAMRMLAECGGIRHGLCIDLGCGTGRLDVELARRSELTIVGLDIDPDMKPIFERRIRAAGLQDRVSFIVGDAQKLPFPDRHADLIISRGMLIFVPDIGQCLREVQRVLKPTGVAFLGGRYLHAPENSRLTADALRDLVSKSGVAGARVVDGRGQWVKILGPQAPKAAREVQIGPQMLAWRMVADYDIATGRALVICQTDGSAEQALQQGLLDATDLHITALYPSESLAKAADARIRHAGLDKRLACKVGDAHALPFEAGSFNLVSGLGGVPFWKDREKAFAEIHRVLQPGGVALVGGVYRYMPESLRLSGQALRATTRRSGLSTIRVYEDNGQWVEITKTADAR